MAPEMTAGPAAPSVERAPLRVRRGRLAAQAVRRDAPQSSDFVRAFFRAPRPGPADFLGRAHPRVSEPVSSIEMWRLVSEARRFGRGVLMSTTYLDEANGPGTSRARHAGGVIVQGPYDGCARTFRETLTQASSLSGRNGLARGRSGTSVMAPAGPLTPSNTFGPAARDHAVEPGPGRTSSIALSMARRNTVPVVTDTLLRAHAT